MATPVQILQWFRSRWQVEVTFEEARAHLGVESQRQWSSQAIVRTTPALLALFSIVTIVAHQQQKQHPFELPQAAWYQKTLPTFADAKSACQTTALANADFSDVECRCRHD